MSGRNLWTQVAAQPTVTVTVAAYGPVFGYPTFEVFRGPALADQGPTVPYADRLKVDVEATGASLLGDVVDAAAEALGVSLPGAQISESITGVVFYEPADDLAFGHRLEPWPDFICLADADGSPIREAPWNLVTVDELQAAGEIGLIDGHPLRPYFWPVTPQGGEPVTVGSALWLLWQIWEHVLSGADTTILVKDALRRVRRARQTIRDVQLDHRGALRQPESLMQFLDENPRTSREVAVFLRWPIEFTEGWLTGTGYVPNADGTWHPGTDRVTRMLNDTVHSIEHLGRTPTEDEIRTRLARTTELPIDEAPSD